MNSEQLGLSFTGVSPDLLETNEDLAPPMVGLNTRANQPLQHRQDFGFGAVSRRRSEIAAAGIEE